MDKLQLSHITNSSLVVRGKVKFIICRADITECKEDMLVNFTNQHIDLSLTDISTALAEKGGEKFKAACQEAEELKEGNITTVPGYRLNCRDVIHCNYSLPRWMHERRTNYQNIIKKCLVKTSAARCKSISIPGGSEDSGYIKGDPVCQWILETLDDHCDLHQRSSLRLVRVVLPLGDQMAQESFDNTMFEVMPKRVIDRHLTEVTDTSMLIGGKVRLSIVRGDITKSKDEVIVNSVGTTLDLSKGSIAPSLASKAGPKLKAACTALAPLKVGDIVETDGYQMGCRIIHCNLAKYEDDTVSQSRMKDLVHKCLAKVAMGNHSSVAIPALGTGSLDYPPAFVAKWVTNAIIDYCEMFARSSLTAVNILLYSTDKATIKGFKEFMNSLVYKEGTDEHLLIYNRLHLDLVWQELADSTEDFIVIRGSSQDPVTIKIDRKAGSELKKARSTLYPLAVGAVEETEAYNMTCKKIAHVNCSQWNEGNTDVLQSVVKGSLERCILQKYRSIGFAPSIFTRKGYPAGLVADSMLKAIAEFCQERPQSCLTTVKLYVPPDDTTNADKEDFKWSVRRHGIKKLSDGFSLAHGAKLEVCKGDLAETSAHFIINSTGSHMALSGGKTSLALLNKAGQALQDQCNEYAPIITGDIVMTEGFGLPCKQVLHVCCPKLWISGETETRLRELIMRCLSWADDTNAESLALPAIGTGLLKYPPQAVAKCVVHAVADFACLNRKSKLKKISLVLFSANTSAIKGVEEALDLDLEEQEIRDSGMTTSLQDGKTVVDLPIPWENPVHEFRECPVADDTREFEDVKKDFNKTLNRPTATILEIRRIQNPETYPLYDTMRKSVARKLNKQEAEVETAPLWHGTSESSVSKIVRTKFDRGTARAKGKLGAGTYFSVSAHYSSNKNFSPPNAAGERYIILARVITGESCLGNTSLTTTKLYKPGEPHLQYDSAVDNLDNPTMYAVFHDAAAYPEYVIKYKY